MLVTASISIVEALRNKSKITIKLNTKIIIWLFLMSASVTVFYWGKNLSSITAPNVGYTGAINASSNAALAIASALIYKQEFKLIKILGISSWLERRCFSAARIALPEFGPNIHRHRIDKFWIFDKIRKWSF